MFNGAAFKAGARSVSIGEVVSTLGVLKPERCYRARLSWPRKDAGENDGEDSDPPPPEDTPETMRQAHLRRFREDMAMHDELARNRRRRRAEAAGRGASKGDQTGKGKSGKGTSGSHDDGGDIFFYLLNGGARGRGNYEGTAFGKGKGKGNSDNVAIGEGSHGNSENMTAGDSERQGRPRGHRSPSPSVGERRLAAPELGQSRQHREPQPRRGRPR